MVRAMKTTAIFMGLLFAMAGCQTLATDSDVAARITNPTDDSRKALQTAVNAALDANVTLANDALTDSSVLTIERNPPRSMENLPAQGANRIEVLLLERDPAVTPRVFLRDVELEVREGELVISPARQAMPVVTIVSQATRPAGSFFMMASTTASEI